MRRAPRPNAGPPGLAGFTVTGLTAPAAVLLLALAAGPAWGQGTFSTLGVSDGDDVTVLNQGGSRQFNGTGIEVGDRSRFSTNGFMQLENDAGSNVDVTIDLNGGVNELVIDGDTAGLSFVLSGAGVVSAGANRGGTDPDTPKSGRLVLDNTDLTAGAGTDLFVGTGAGGFVGELVANGGSVLDFNGDANVGTDDSSGNGGTGTLTVQDGSSATFEDLTVGSLGTGTVNVDGLGSALTVNQDFLLGTASDGTFGSGTLNVTGGAELTVAGGLLVGSGASDGAGTVLIDGPSTADIASLQVGDDGSSDNADTFTVSNGATVMLGGSGVVPLDSSVEAGGTLTVSAGSIVENAGALAVSDGAVIDNDGTIDGAVTLDGGTVIGDDGTFGGDFTANGPLELAPGDAVNPMTGMLDAGIGTLDFGTLSTATFNDTVTFAADLMNGMTDVLNFNALAFGAGGMMVVDFTRLDPGMFDGSSFTETIATFDALVGDASDFVFGDITGFGVPDDQFSLDLVFDDPGNTMGAGELVVSFNSPAAVPEPGTWALIGLAVAGGVARRRRRAAADTAA